MNNLKKLTLCFLIIANICLVTFIVYSQQQSETVKVLPNDEFLGNPIVKQKIEELKRRSNSDKIAIALLTSVSTSCSTGKLTNSFRNTSERTQNQNLFILLPNQFSDADVENFRANMKYSHQVEKADVDLANFWVPFAEKYEATGVVIIVDGENISTLQDTDKINEILTSF